MLLSLLLLLPVCSAQVNLFFGTVMTYYPGDTSTNGDVTVDVHYKLYFQTCTDLRWQCLSGDCGNESVVVNTVSIDGLCQTEGISTRQVPSNAPFQLWFNGSDWLTNQNGIVDSRAVTLVELATRSDTGRANASPQTTILPILRVPSNCQKEFSLLAFDPDGDNVRCRFGNASLSECNPCTPPTGLTLLSDCTFSISPSFTEGIQTYAVQIVMEDFPTQNITLTQTNGSQTLLTPSDPISKIPVQFLLLVAPQVPSCVLGLYIPLFLPPTPASGAQLYTPVNQNLQIDIAAQANISTIHDLLVSRPYNAVQNKTGPGQFTVTWTPSQSEAGQSVPICFIVRAINDSAIYQSEFRCVVVTVGNSPAMSTSVPSSLAPNATSEAFTSTNLATPSTTSAPPPPYVVALTVALSVTLSSATSPSSADLTSAVQQVQQTLVSLGLPQNISMRLVSYRPAASVV